MIYRLFFKLLIALRVDAEVAHFCAARALKLLTRIPGVRPTMRRLLTSHDPSLEVEAFGKTFPSPLGVAAGVDKDASWFEGLALLGFGCVEVGTVTALPQEGNEKPRVFRLPSDRALLNRMGFPNPGAEVVARRLRRGRNGTIVGVNIGKSRAVALEDAGADYIASVRQVAPFADYLVLNVSSPNTPGLRDLQSPELWQRHVRDLRSELEQIGVDVPLLLKIGPDLSDEDLAAIVDAALAVNLDGIVAINTTTETDVLSGSREVAAERGYGGISGAPLKRRAVEVLERLRARAGDNLVLVSVGGIETADDVWDRLVAGATLVQAHTGFVYGGPLWPRRINRELSRRIRAVGASSAQRLVGARARTSEENGDRGAARDASDHAPTRVAVRSTRLV